MRKIAVFVEGQTELITVREFLLKKYQYTNINIECYALLGKGTFKPVEYKFPQERNPSADVLFSIRNVGNDNNVASAILKSEVALFERGFEKIIGLRDMYSKEYREFSSTISQELNQRIINNNLIRIEKGTINFERIFLCFSIMEIEAWFLALHTIFAKLHPDLTVDFINENLGFDLATINPETAFFHPAETLLKIYDLRNLIFDKHKGDIESICSKLCIEDFEMLYASDKCNSFNEFIDKLL